MKKIKILLSIILLSFTTIFLNFNVLQATSGSASGNNTVVEGNNIVVTFSIKTTEIVSSGSIEISCSSSLSVVSGKFTLADTKLASFESNNKGAFAFAPKPDGSCARTLNGSYFTITLKANKIDTSAWVKAVITLKNNENNVKGTTITKNISIICKNHSYGEYTTLNPTCESAGYKTRKCNVCGTLDKTILPATGHSTESLTVKKEPTCTQTGISTGICSVCGKEVTVTTKAKGHDFGSWDTLISATCIEHGKETHTCKVCGYQETRTTQLANHIVKNGEVIKEPTLTSYGIVEGVCEVCNQTVRTESQCRYHDLNSGYDIYCNQGVFIEGTTLQITQIKEDNQLYQMISPILANISSQFRAFDISAYIMENKIQPNGRLTLYVDVPSEFSDKVCLICLTQDGKFEVLHSEIVEGRLVSELSHFSIYAIIDMKKPAPSNLFKYTTIGLSALSLVLLICLLAKKEKNPVSFKI